MERSYRVLIADDDFVATKGLRDFLVEKGFEIRTEGSGKAAIEAIREWDPHFILSNLILPEGGAHQILDFIRQDARISKLGIKVMVTSSHNSVQNVRSVITAGACDYLIKPFRFEDVVQRLVFHINAKRQVSENELKTADKDRTPADTHLHMMDLLLRQALLDQPPQATLFSMTRMLALAVKAVRCSIIQCDMNELKGFVLASSDDQKVTNFQIDLNRYPEVMHVMTTEKIVVIENMDYDPVLSEIKKHIKNISFNSMIVCPIRRRGQFFGVISARMANDAKALGDYEVKFARLVSYVSGLVCERVAAETPSPASNSKTA